MIDCREYEVDSIDLPKPRKIAAKARKKYRAVIISREANHILRDYVITGRLFGKKQVSNNAGGLGQSNNVRAFVPESGSIFGSTARPARGGVYTLDVSIP